jgi:nucleotide-binding universal stress UspA family protein
MESYSAAVSDFRKARDQAGLQKVIGRLRGRSIELLSYEEVRQKLKASGIVSMGLKDIPLESIVGSVGRYHDFTRSFLPVHDSDQDRWARVRVATSEMSGLPPVELFQIGDAFFVSDGHHRISVARQLGATHIEAYVTEIRSKVPIPADFEPEDLIRAADYVDFLEQTRLDELRQEADLTVTCAGQYEKLFEHIDVHRYYMGVEQQREISYEEAVVHWYDHVYFPVIQSIQELGVLRDFPNRTETDLYLWIAKHRADIEEGLGWEIPYDEAAVDLVDKESSRWSRFTSRIGNRVLEVVDAEDGTPDSGTENQRSKKKAIDRNPVLFRDILVAVSGKEKAWLALEQAITVANKESGKIRGLYVAEDPDQASSAIAQDVRDRFLWRCGEVGIQAEFATDVGPVAKTICDRSRWVDLVVVNLAHPPENSAISRYQSGFRTLLKRCSRPVLAVPGVTTSLSHPLLAYDGRPKAQEALYIASYMAARWHLPLTVVTVCEDGVTEKTLEFARKYLEPYDINAHYELVEGSIAASLLQMTQERDNDLIMMGGYGGNPVLEVVLGTAIDEILAEADIPIIVCH